MPNPREWFRRRRSAALGSAAEESDDPFSGDGILDLGRGAMLIHETTPPAEPKRPEIGERRDHVPPPPPRAAVARREGRMLDRSAFTIMPEIVRSGDAPRAGATVAPAHFSVHRGQRPHIAAAPRPATAEAKLVPPAREPADAARPAAPAPESEQAAFTIAAPGVAWKRTRSSLPAAGAQGALLREAFTPTRPKQSNAVFSGRFKQMQRIIAAIEEERAHVMVFGERGSGKTSLANVLASKAEEAGYVVLRFACSSELTFEDIFRGLLRRMPATLLADGIAATTRAGVDNLEQLLPGSCSVV